MMKGLPLKLAHEASALTRTLWFAPLVMALGGVVMGIALPAADRLPSVQRALAEPWARTVLASTPDGARQLLGTGAGALATILGVAFSLTLVTLQLAAQQYTPRLIGRLMDDAVTKLVLGSYIGSTAYLLLVLRAVHAAAGKIEEFVPSLSIAVGIVLFLYCLALLAVFLHHLGRSTQAASVIGDVSRKTIRRIRRGELRCDAEAERSEPTGSPALVPAREHGYVQLVDLERIAGAAPRGTTFIRVSVSAGDFVFASQELAKIWGPPRPLDDDELAALRAGFGIGHERTPEQDLLLAVQQVSDVALKALSPSLNDETTVILAVNELGAIGSELARADVPAEGGRQIYDGGFAVVAPVLGMRRFLREGFRELIRNAAGHPRVLARVAEVLGAITALTKRGDSRAALLEATEWISETMAELGATSRARLEGKLLEIRSDVGGTGIQ